MIKRSRIIRLWPNPKSFLSKFPDFESFFRSLFFLLFAHLVAMSDALAVPTNSNTGGVDVDLADLENQPPNTLGPDQTYNWLTVANAHARPIGREQSAVVAKFKQAVQLKVHGQYRLSKDHRAVLAEARQQQQEKLQQQ